MSMIKSKKKVAKKVVKKTAKKVAKKKTPEKAHPDEEKLERKRPPIKWSLDKILRVRDMVVSRRLEDFRPSLDDLIRDAIREVEPGVSKVKIAKAVRDEVERSVESVRYEYEDTLTRVPPQPPPEIQIQKVPAHDLQNHYSLSELGAAYDKVLESMLSSSTQPPFPQEEPKDSESSSGVLEPEAKVKSPSLFKFRVLFVGLLDRQFEQFKKVAQKQVDLSRLELVFLDKGREESASLPGGIDKAIVFRFTSHKGWNRVVERYGKRKVLFVTDGGSLSKAVVMLEDIRKELVGV